MIFDSDEFDSVSGEIDSESDDFDSASSLILVILILILMILILILWILIPIQSESESKLAPLRDMGGGHVRRTCGENPTWDKCMWG